MYRFGLIALASLLAIPAIDLTSAKAKVKIDINIGGGDRDISCKRGAYILEDGGYHHIVKLDCEGRYYEYRARRGPRLYLLKMNSRNGDIVDRRRLYY